VAGAAKCRKVGLERADLGPHDELAMGGDACDRLVNRAAKPTALRREVDKRDGSGFEAGVLIHWSSGVDGETRTD
jgi:hypothetical protein